MVRRRLEDEDESKVELTHINLNDQTVEGFRHKNCRSSASVPSGSLPGPHDSDYLFAKFIGLMDAAKQGPVKKSSGVKLQATLMSRLIFPLDGREAQAPRARR